MSSPIIEVKDLQKFFPLASQGIFSRVKGDNKAVNGVSFSWARALITDGDEFLVACKSTKIWVNVNLDTAV